MKIITFENRREAGRRLARVLVKRGYGGNDTLVLGIPRGGLAVADEVAKALSTPLDTIIVRRLRAPFQPNLGIGAVVDREDVVLNEDLAHAVGASKGYLSIETSYQKEEAGRRMRFYRNDWPDPEIAHKTVILVDDGIATGYTFRACLESIHRRGASRLAAAVPVATRESTDMLKGLADDVICLSTPASVKSVGTWYRNFDRVSDEEAVAILRRHRSRWPLAA